MECSLTSSIRGLVYVAVACQSNYLGDEIIFEGHEKKMEDVDEYSTEKKSFVWATNECCSHVERSCILHGTYIQYLLSNKAQPKGGCFQATNQSSVTMRL